MADVFISYRNLSDRRALVSRLATILRSHGIEVWWDYGLAAGQSYRAQITQKLAEAKLVIVMWDEESVISKWVLMEAELGKDKLLPAKLQNISPPEAFEAIQAHDLTDWDGSVLFPRLDEFVKTICNRLDKPQSMPVDTREELAQLPKVRALPTRATQLTKNLSKVGYTSQGHEISTGSSLRTAPVMGITAVALLVILGLGIAAWRSATFQRPEAELGELSGISESAKRQEFEGISEQGNKEFEAILDVRQEEITSDTTNGFDVSNSDCLRLFDDERLSNGGLNLRFWRTIDGVNFWLTRINGQNQIRLVDVSLGTKKSRNFKRGFSIEFASGKIITAECSRPSEVECLIPSPENERLLLLMKKQTIKTIGVLAENKPEITPDAIHAREIYLAANCFISPEDE